MKMKKILCLFVLACLIFGTAFAQARPATPAPAPAQPAKPATPPPAPAQPSPAKPAEGSQNELKNALGLDLFQLFKGFIASDDDSKYSVFIISAGFEHLIAPHFSIGGDLDFYLLKFNKIDGSYFGLALEGRYYPVSNFDKFFLGATLGFNVLTIDGSSKAEDGGFTGLTTSLKAGYKVILNKTVYLEPSLAYVLSKSGGGFFNVPIPLGWNGGLLFGFLF
jgi:hypothetical protein